MRGFAIAALVGVLPAVATPAAAAESYQVDPAHTSMIFGISHMGLSYTYGRFNKVSGNFELNPDDLAESKFKITVDASSVDTNSPGRDEHLRGPDFFNAAQFPLIGFESTRVVPNQNDGKTVLTVTGDLTMHGVTKPISFDMLMLGQGAGPRGDYRAGFHMETKLKRSDYGMTGMIPNIGDEVAVTMSFEGVRSANASVPRRTKAALASTKTAEGFKTAVDWLKLRNPLSILSLSLFTSGLENGASRQPVVGQ